MRSALSYTPRPGILQSAAPGAAIAYLGALVVVAFLYSSPLVLAATGIAAAIAGILAGAGAAVRVAARMGLTLALLIVAVNGLVTDRGDTVLARLGDWPLLGQVNVTAEALAAGAVIGLRAAVVMVALAVYSACVDPDLVLRSLRPLARRSALTATLISRMVPLAAADGARLREAAALRGPGAAAVGRGPLARRLLAGTLDRAVDAAASLELRGYGLERASRPPPGALAPRPSPLPGRARADRRRARREARGRRRLQRLSVARVSSSASTLLLSALVLCCGLVPWRRRPRRRAAVAREAARA